MKKSKNIDEVFDGLESIRGFADELDTLSKAFDIIGNERVSYDLNVMFVGIRKDCGKVQKAFVREVQGG